MAFIQSELGSADSGPPSETTINYILFNLPAVHCLKSFFEFQAKQKKSIWLLNWIILVDHLFQKQ